MHCNNHFLLATHNTWRSRQDTIAMTDIGEDRATPREDSAAAARTRQHWTCIWTCIWAYRAGERHRLPGKDSHQRQRVTMPQQKKVFRKESKQKLCLVEFQTRKRQPNEQWNAFGDELRMLTDKAFLELDDKAKELPSLEQYLCELDNPKISFDVRQRQPKTLDKAVMCTLETESYIVTPEGLKVQLQQ